MLTGGCFCGAVRYGVSGAVFHATLCHCSDCRRISGAPRVAWFSAAAADFRFTAGTPRRFASSGGAVRRFCAECGTGLTFQHAALPQEIDITTASLDTPEQAPPADPTCTKSRLPWVKPADGLPAHETTRRDWSGMRYHAPAPSILAINFMRLIWSRPRGESLSPWHPQGRVTRRFGAA